MQRRLEKEPPDLIAFFGDRSLAHLQNLKESGLIKDGTAIYLWTPDTQNESSDPIPGVMRTFTSPPWENRSLVGEMFVDNEILKSAWKRADLISREKIFEDRCIGMICASTGGPRLVSQIISQTTLSDGSLVVLQHMDKRFVDDFAKRISETSPYDVIVVKTESDIRAQTVYLPSGGCHLIFFRDGHRLRLRSVKLDLVDSYKPSINLALLSAAAHLHSNCVALILSGMGEDGAIGASALNARGAEVLFQNPETCTVPSMPLAILKSGCGRMITANESLSDELMRGLASAKKRKAS